MNWEQLYKLLGEMIGEDGKVPPEMEEQVCVFVGDGEMSIELSQALTSGKLTFIPLVDET